MNVARGNLRRSTCGTPSFCQTQTQFHQQLELWGQDSSVGIATRYPVQSGLVAQTASYTMGTGSFPGGKAAGAWLCPPTPYSAEANERA